MTQEPMIVNTEDSKEAMRIDSSGKVGIGTPTPTNPLHVSGNEGLRQNELYMSGGVGWSSLSYNAHHNDANNNWVFPDPSHTAVTIEMDDNGGHPRFQVWSTTPGNPTSWSERFAIDGNSGKVGIGNPNPAYQLDVQAPDQLGLAVRGPFRGVGAGLQFIAESPAIFHPPFPTALESSSFQAIPNPITFISKNDWELLATGSTSAQGAGKFNIRNLVSTADVFTITGQGNIGIGNTAPNEKLHVEGSLFVNGSITKTGSGELVVQPHPVNHTQNIVYATPIGDEIGTYTRGTWKLEEGKAVIELPEHFGFITSEDGLSVQLTPRGEWLQLYVVELSTKQLVVQEAQGKNGQFDYLIQGVRKGYEHHEAIQEKK